MGLERGYPTRAEFLDHIRRDWRSAHSIRRGIYDYVELDYTKVKGLTAKSIPYAGATGYLTEDNANFQWDYSTDTLKVGTISISDGSIIDSGGSISFGNENLVTTGTLGAGNATLGTITATTAVFSGLLSNTAGAKLEIQNATDGTSAKGIFLWDSGDSNWGIYMAQSGGSKSLADGAACTNFAGDTVHHIRFRVNDAAGVGFIWENGSESCLMDLEGDTGNLSILGTLDVRGGNIISNSGAISFGDENLSTTGTLGCGVLTSGNIIIPDAGNIGSVSDIDAIAIAADGKITLTQDLIVNEDIIIGDAKYIGSASDPDAIQIEADGDIVISQDLAITGTLGAGNATLGTIGCGTITVADGGSINLQEDITFLGATTENLIKFPDNLAVALAFKEGANAYQTFITTNGSEAIQFHKNVGIGTAAPASLLSLGNAVDAIKLLLYDNADNWKHGFGIQANELRTFFPSDAGFMTIGVISTGDGTTFAEKVRITKDGNLGIGCTPVVKLDVKGVDGTTSYIVERLSGGTSGYGSFIHFSDGYTYNFAIGTIPTTGDFAFYSGRYPGAAGTERMKLTHAGALTVSGCVSDGTCEIMKNENAIEIIDYILRTGTGKKDIYNHERMDMKKIYNKYPFLIYESIDENGKKEYYDKIGAKGDLAYVAIKKLNEEIIILKNRIQELEA